LFAFLYALIIFIEINPCTPKLSFFSSGRNGKSLIYYVSFLFPYSDPAITLIAYRSYGGYCLSLDREPHNWWRSWAKRVVEQNSFAQYIQFFSRFSFFSFFRSVLYRYILI